MRSARISKDTEKEQEEQKLTQHEQHVKVNKEKHFSEANTKPMMETDVEKPSDPVTEDGNTQCKLAPMSVPPYDPPPPQGAV